MSRDYPYRNGLEHTSLIAPSKLRWRGIALSITGCLLIVGALIVGGTSDLLTWALFGIISQPLHLLSLIALYVLPGLALLRLLWSDTTVSLAAYLALAAGLSVAIAPLLLLLCRVLHVHWNAAVSWGYLLLCTVVAGWPRRASRYSFRLTSTDAVLGAITLAALLVQLYIVRDLPTGLFGDSYHHTMITQLLVSNQGLFDSWQPYAPLVSFTYHFGFHTNAAFAHWITGIDVPHSVVLTGQILNALSVPMAFLLVITLRGSPWAGIWAGVITGFVFTMPSFYVNWGRYTQLTGHIVLVVVLACWGGLATSAPANQFLRSRERYPPPVLWKYVLLAALSSAAIILTHYLVTIFTVLFVGSFLLAWLLVNRSWRVCARMTFLALVTTLLAILISSPWVFNLLNGYLVRNAAGFVNGAIAPEHIASYAALPALVPQFAKGPVIFLALCGVCLAGWRRDWRMALPMLWSVLLVLCVVPYLVGLPGAGIIDNLTGLGALYLTLPLGAGYALASIQGAVIDGLTYVWYRLMPHQGMSSSTNRQEGTEQTDFCNVSGNSDMRGRRGIALVSNSIAVLLVAGCLAWGTSWHMDVIDGSTRFVTDVDSRAMEWIRANTAPDAHFLVNSFPAYGGTVVAGTDAGWWIPVLTDRTSTLPPIIYTNEEPAYPAYWHDVNTFAEKLRGKPLTDPAPVAIDLTTTAARQVLHDAGVDYVYIGAHAAPGPELADHIDAALLRHADMFRLVYDQDGVMIFAFEREK